MNFPLTVVAVFVLTFVWLYITRISYADMLPHSLHISSRRTRVVRAPRPLLKTSELSEEMENISSGEELHEESKPNEPPPVPSIMYGTAWKGVRTQIHVSEALEAGFRAIDTANQGKHYNEFGVGRAITRAIEQGIVSRDQLFLQTKFTHTNAQDPATIPYDRRLPPAQQVRKASTWKAHAHMPLPNSDNICNVLPLRPPDPYQSPSRTRLAGYAVFRIIIVAFGHHICGLLCIAWPVARRPHHGCCRLRGLANNGVHLQQGGRACTGNKQRAHIFSLFILLETPPAYLVRQCCLRLGA
eukprot:8352173-Pyramimonas_sp.AAC.3